MRVTIFDVVCCIAIILLMMAAPPITAAVLRAIQMWTGGHDNLFEVNKNERLLGFSTMPLWRYIRQSPVTQWTMVGTDWCRCVFHRIGTIPASANANREQVFPASEEDIVMALGMVSGPANTMARHRVRSTMLQLPSFRSGSVAFRFVVGARAVATACEPSDGNNADMLLVDGVLDGAPVNKQCSCIEKVHYWFVWALRRWPRAQFYAKTEDDTYVNIEQLRFDLARPAVRTAAHLIYGLLNICASPASVGEMSSGGPNGSTCFLGDFEGLRLGVGKDHSLHKQPLSNHGSLRKSHCPETVADGAPPMPFPTGPLMVLSPDLARALFVDCAHVKDFMAAGRASNRRAGMCASDDPLLRHSLGAFTCDCVLGGWLGRCASSATLAHMTWTKGHHWARDGGGAGWVQASASSLAVHWLKKPHTNQWAEVHRASSASNVTHFPPLLWHAQWTVRQPIPSLTFLHTHEHRWYSSRCVSRRTDNPLWREQYKGFGCHPSRGWPEEAIRYGA